MKLFSLILETQIRLARHYSTSLVWRFMNDLVIADDWHALLEQLNKLDTQINHALSDFDRDAMDALRKQFTEMELNLSSKITVGS